MEYESYNDKNIMMQGTALHNSGQFSWRGIDHPLNALPAVPANAGKTLDVEALAAYAVAHKKERRPEKGQGECASAIIHYSLSLFFKFYKGVIPAQAEEFGLDDVGVFL